MVNANHATSWTVKLKLTFIRQHFSVTHRQPYIYKFTRWEFSLTIQIASQNNETGIYQKQILQFKLWHSYIRKDLNYQYTWILCWRYHHFCAIENSDTLSTAKRWNQDFVTIFSHNYQPAWLTELTSTAIVFSSKVNVQKWRETWDELSWISLSI